MYVVLYLDPLTVDIRVDDDVKETDDLVIECDARGGNPEHIESYHWEFYPKYENTEVDMSCYERECYLDEVGLEHAGFYNCTASNWGGFYRSWNVAPLNVKCKLHHYAI